jgi:ribosome-binding protein aMBF1 (putative translation factor)
MIAEQMLNNMSMYFPWIFDEMTRYEVFDEWALTVETSDGTVYLYNDMNNSIRRLPAHPAYMTDDEIKKEFGLRLQYFLDRKGISQKELAERVGASSAQISHYVRGRYTPQFTMLDRIARALGCSMDDLRYTGIK